MPKSVVMTATALKNMSSVARWLMQPGSGYFAHRRLDEIQQGIADLADDAMLYQQDPDRPRSRLAIIHRYAVRFRVRQDGTVVVQRVFGPGQKRN